MPKIQPYPGTNRDIEQIAGRLRSRVSEMEGASEWSASELLRELVRRTGGDVRLVEDPSDQEVDGGSLVIRGEGDYTIFLSPYTTPLRDNFTIAHELGHYVLHFFRSQPRPAAPLWFARYGTDPVEWQANRFAAALLMPEPDFRKSFEDCKGDLFLLSGTFDVSLSAVSVRAKSLGLLDRD